MANFKTPREERKGWTTSGLLKTSGIPTPTGPYGVGAVEIMSENGLPVRLFYPTHVQQADGPYQYIPCSPDIRYTKALCQIFEIKPVWLISNIAGRLVDARAPALFEAPLFNNSSDSQTSTERFPVIVYSHGLTAFRGSYNVICCDLASHGYVVAALEHKDQSACLTFNRVPGPGVAEGDYDNYINEWVPLLIRPPETLPLRYDQVRQRSAEISKTLDLLQSLNDDGSQVKNLMGGKYNLGQFTGRLDIHKAAVMGHSFGGASTVVTLATDNRFCCGIALDTWMFPVENEVYEAGISQPLMFINSFHDFQMPVNISKMMRLVTPPDDTGISKCSLVTIKDTHHYSQTDASFVMPSFLSKKYVTANAYETIKTNSDLCIAFLKRHVLKDPEYQGRVPILDGGEESSEQVLYGTNIEWKDAEERDQQQQLQTGNHTDQQTGADTDQQTGADTDQQTGADTNQQTGADTNQQTGADTDQQTGADTDQQTDADTDQQTGADTDQQTGTDTDQQTRADTDQQTSTNTDQQTGTDTDQQTGTGTSAGTDDTVNKQNNNSVVVDHQAVVSKDQLLEEAKTDHQPIEESKTDQPQQQLEDSKTDDVIQHNADNDPAEQFVKNDNLEETND